MTTQTLKIDDVIWTDDYYPRLSGTDWQTVAQYTDAMRLGAKFPPIKVGMRRGKAYGLDGRHTCAATKCCGYENIQAEVISEPPSRWLELAVQYNIRHGRKLTYQDRIAVAARMRAQGINLERVAKAVSIMADRLTALIAERVTSSGTLKSATAHLRLTAYERDAMSSQGPIANGHARRTLDEVLALLNAHAFDLDDDAIRGRLVALRDALADMALQPRVE